MRRALRIAIVGLIFPLLSHAEGPSQTGEISFQTEEKRGSKYEASQAASLAYFQSLASLQERAQRGEVVAPAAIPEDVLFHLTGVFLYCSVNSGTCPLVLDAILETDIMTSKVNGRPECPNMKRFWNAWVQNGMEQRHKYLVHTSFINEHTSFNTNRRPAYLKCVPTVETEIKGGAAGPFFSQRYRQSAPQGALGSRMVELLSQLKAKGINVFLATGAQKDAPSTADDAKKKGQSSGKTQAQRAPQKSTVRKSSK